MSAIPNRLVIATRQSRLALWQAEHVRQVLQARHRTCKVELLGLSTRGDEVLDRSLAKIGGKGLFVKELENAIHEGRADLAVHSAKDVPMELPAGFAIGAFLERADARDALVSNRHASLAAIPAGGIVGTSSLRREAQLRARFPHLQFRALRGNVDTRLAKLDRGEYDAIVLAVAGLERLGLGARIRAILDPEESLPAVGQGALAIEYASARAEVGALLATLEDASTAACVRAERALGRALGGSCQLPLAAYAQIDAAGLHLRGLVASADGLNVVRAAARGAIDDPEDLGLRLAQQLRAAGAASILATVGAS